jgi:multicomponent Na+:H+ antiporter subunit E
MMRGYLLIRSALLGFGTWALYTGLQPGDVEVGIVAACAIAGLSVFRRPDTYWLRLWAVPGFALFFVGQSLLTGLHVARLALSPSSAWKPGWLTLPSRLPEGPARALFGNLVSLLPGTLCGDLDDDGVHHIHLLQAHRNPEGSLRALERRVARLYGLRPAPDGSP